MASMVTASTVATKTVYTVANTTACHRCKDAATNVGDDE